MTRLFNAEYPKGIPHNLQVRQVPQLNPIRFQPVVPNVIHDINICDEFESNSFAPFFDYFSLRPDQAVAVARSARLYHDAVELVEIARC
jgi:hypothetical protein